MISKPKGNHDHYINTAEDTKRNLTQRKDSCNQENTEKKKFHNMCRLANEN
jgi:hypothetical protein